MKKQNKIQLTLLLTGLMLFILTYIYYPNLNKNKFLKNKTVQEDEEVSFDSKKGTSFEDVKYKGFYNLDKLFTVEAEKAYILSEETDVVYMNNMQVILHLNDGRIVNITSNKGKYNKTTYDCFFENNVRATDGETEIFSENLDLVATENSVEIYNNVILNYTTGSLRADKIDYNFETKYFKVSMFDDKTIKMKVIK